MSFWHLDEFSFTIKWVPQDDVSRLEQSQTFTAAVFNAIEESYHAQNALHDKCVYVPRLPCHDQVSNLDVFAVPVVPLVYQAEVTGDIERWHHAGSKRCVYFKAVFMEQVT